MNVATSYGSDTLYDMIRGRALLQIHQQSPEQAVSRMAREDADDTAQRYVSALVDAKNGQVDAALQALDQLADEQPDLAMLPGSAAEVALQAQRYDEAIRRSQQLLRLMPNYLPAQLVLAEAQLQRDPNAAYDVLRDVTAQHPENPQGFNLLAEAAGRSGRNGWGHLARAEYLQLTGRMDSGIRQLDIAEDAAERENDQRALARIERRREDFMDYRDALEEF